jgi:hypothetical protein
MQFGFNAKSQRGKTQPKSPWPDNRAEAQRARRKNFAKNADFSDIALQGKKANVAPCPTLSVWRLGLPKAKFSLRLCVFAPLR